MGKRLHVVKRQREDGCTEAFNWCFDKFRKLLDVLGCNVCADDESSDFWEMTKDEYKRAITILKMMKDVPMDGDYKEQKEKIDQIYNSEKYQELFSNDECILSITTDDIELHDVIDSVKNIDIDLDELISIMESFLKESDNKSNWIQFEAW